MKRRGAVVVALILSVTATLVAVGSKKAEYVGGTVTALKEKAEGTFDTKSSDDFFEFIGSKKSDGSLGVPYKDVVELEYGQKAGRRVAVAVLISPLALFSKKRNHFLTITFNDTAGKEQAAVFELGKDIIRTTLEILKVRTGKPIYCQDEDARKDYGGCTVRPSGGK
jgi:hypothetical protein